TVLNVRDAWLQADVNRYAGANKCLLWVAFASREFNEALTNAEWPPFQGGPPYILPKLHLLYLGTFDEWLFQFSLPALKSFSTVRVENPGSLFKIDAKHTYVTYGDFKPISGRHSESSASDDDSPDTHHIVVNCRKGTFRVKTKYYPKPPPTSSLFGRFLNTIKALFIPYDGLELNKVLYFFPNLKYLTWYINKVTDSRASSPMVSRTELQYVAIAAKTHDQSVANVINILLDAQAELTIPDLKNITLYSRLHLLESIPYNL
ncbi:hypothetical protein E4T56_gene17208, partial [Termitomyces sp. T112]